MGYIPDNKITYAEMTCRCGGRVNSISAYRCLRGTGEHVVCDELTEALRYHGRKELQIHM